MADQSETAQKPKTTKIWDLPTRLFHWLLVAFIGLSYLTGEVGGFDFTVPGTDRFLSNMNVHMISGYVILALLLFRLVWGFMGSSSSRFVSFIAAPGVILNYAKTILSGPIKFFAGHNPAGGAFVVIILLALAVQVVTGLFAQDEAFFATKAPLVYLISDEASKAITSFHKQWFEIAIITVIVLHIAANLFYWLVKRQDLIGAMFTGRRRLPDGEAEPSLAFKSSLLGLAVFAVAAAIVWIIVNLETF